MTNISGKSGGAGFHDPLVTSQVMLPSERSTGLVFATVFLIVAYFFRESIPFLIAAIVIAVAFALLSFLAPSCLGPLNRAWFQFSLLLGRIVNPVVMFLMFVIAFVPMGLLMRFWRDPLIRERHPELSTYWIQRGPDEPSGSMRNQF